MSWPRGPGSSGVDAAFTASSISWTARRPSPACESSALRVASTPASIDFAAAAAGWSAGSCALPMALVMARDSILSVGSARTELEPRAGSGRRRHAARACTPPRARRTPCPAASGRSVDDRKPWVGVPRGSPPGEAADALFGLRGRRRWLLFLADDEHLLTVHLDGAPVTRRFALRLRGTALAPLPQLLLQVLEHPLLRPTGMCFTSPAPPVGVYQLRSRRLTDAARTSRASVHGSGCGASAAPWPRSAGCAR